jgi:acetyltransferase-like isoleucine patch superfamily enzyme
MEKAYLKNKIKKISIYLLNLGCSLVVLPGVMLFKINKSESFFSFFGQLVSLIPGKIGSYIRINYYCRTMQKFPRKGFIGFGTFFAHPNSEIGERIYIGAYCIIGTSKIGNDTIIGSGVHILSGRHQHGFHEFNTPIQKQRGYFKKIKIGDNCWIGNGSIIMANVGRQNVIGAGSVVNKDTKDFEISAGNPAKCIRNIIGNLPNDD